MDKRDRPPVCGRQVMRDRPPVCGKQVRRDRPPVCGRQVRRGRPPVCGRQVRRAGDIAGERRENDVRVCSEVLNSSMFSNFFIFKIHMLMYMYALFAILHKYHVCTCKMLHTHMQVNHTHSRCVHTCTCTDVYTYVQLPCLLTVKESV